VRETWGGDRESASVTAPKAAPEKPKRRAFGDAEVASVSNSSVTVTKGGRFADTAVIGPSEVSKTVST